ncbi:MAG TPA: TetR/AcrR family transcriptional regulator [Propionibacteriaceae bacterium]|nr:TetR/AcrR family transcriptional regulator [Propionibacteriaceae bacterium]
MSTTANGEPEKRVPLSRERVLRAAVAIADATGIGSLTMRSLANELGVKPMALYYHVANKEEILDGIVDLVFSEIELPSADADWRSEITRRAESARRALRRHPWAIGLMESRKTPGPETLRHHDATIGTLRAAGFSVEMTAHAYALLDSYIYGFALQEASLPFEGPDTVVDVAEPMLQQFPAEAYPHFVEMATEYILKPGYDFGNEFKFGLDVILDALSRSLSDQGESIGSRA